MSNISSVVQWYGGKAKLAHQIISIMPDHSHYVEVFMGGAAIFFNKPKSSYNTLNDVNGNLTNLFIQVRDHFDELAEKIYWTLYSREQYKKFYHQYEQKFRNLNDLDRALAYLFLVRSSFSANVDGGCFSSAVDGNSATSFNASLVERLKVAKDKLDSVVIENQSFIQLIPKYDRKGILIYCDPPYWETGDKGYYEYGFSWELHQILFNILSKLKTNWLLSYDNHPEVINLYKDFYIQKLKIKYSFGSTNKKSIVKDTSELLISNFKQKKPQLDVFDETVQDEVTDEEKLQAENYALNNPREDDTPTVPKRRETPEQTSLF